MTPGAISSHTEKSPRNQGFHWNGNARSYFRVGKGLGDNMVNLLNE